MPPPNRNHQPRSCSCHVMFLRFTAQTPERGGGALSGTGTETHRDTTIAFVRYSPAGGTRLSGLGATAPTCHVTGCAGSGVCLHAGPWLPARRGRDVAPVQRRSSPRVRVTRTGRRRPMSNDGGDAGGGGARRRRRRWWWHQLQSVQRRRAAAHPFAPSRVRGSDTRQPGLRQAARPRVVGGPSASAA